MLLNNITEYIGETPIIKIDNAITGLKHVNLFVKCELYNPFGSLKDRAAYSMLMDNLEELKKTGKTVIESSSGNTAKALQVICSINGIPFKTVTNRIKVPETKKILKVVGAEIEELPGLSECPDPSDPNDPVAYIDRIVSKDPQKYFHVNQYTNLKNPEIHYRTTGPEIQRDIGKVDYFFGTLGTTGSTRGTISYLQEQNPEMKKIGIIAEKGDNIPGIRNKDEMYEVGIFKKDLYDQIMVVNSMQAIDQMLVLIRKIGILAGPTSGACLQGALDYLQELDKTLDHDVTAVFIACDRMEWYMSYIEKRRPDIFDESIHKESIKTLTEEDYEYAKQIDCCDVEDFIDENNPIIIDLRGNLAYKNAHIKGAINITDAYFEEIVDNGIPFSKSNIILLVCAVGDKSRAFSALLNKKGMKVYSMNGGMVSYRDEGLPMERSIKVGIR